VSRSGRSPLAVEAAALLDSVETNPRNMLPIARRIADEAKAKDDLVAAALGLRAAGIAARLATTLPDALQLFDESVAIASTIPDGRTILGECRTSRAAALLGLGRIDEAMQDLHFAVTTLDGVPLAFAQFQQASVWARQGRAAEAMEVFDNCLKIFVAAKHAKYEAHTRANRALLAAYDGDFALADEDQRRAAELYEHLGLQDRAALAVHNRGFVAASRGELLEALRLYRTAQRHYELLGQPIAVVRLDQAEALQSLGLADQALELAGKAIAELEEAGNFADLAEAHLMAAFAAELAEQHQTACDHANRAAALFHDQSRSGWSELAELLVLRQNTRLRPTEEDFSSALDLHRQLEAYGHHHHARLAILTAADLALGLNDPVRSTQTLKLIDTNAPMPVETKLQHASLLAECQLANDDSNGFEQTLSAGLSLYLSHQRRFGSFEARANLGRHVHRLHQVALTSAYRDRDAARILERVLGMRSASLQVRTAGVSGDTETVELLNRLRALTLQTHRNPTDRDRVEQERADLQRRIAAEAHVAAAAAGDLDFESPWESARARLGDNKLIAFAEIEGRLLSLTARASGSVQMSDCGPSNAIRDAVQALALTANRLSRSDQTSKSRQASEQFLTACAENLERTLGLGELVLGAASVVISPPSWMFGWPWATLPSLHGTPFALAPTYRVQSPCVHGTGTALIAGPDLLTGVAEVEAIAEVWRDSITVMPDEATTTAVLTAIERSRIVHVAAHFEVNTQRPLFSSINLADGPLYADEVARLRTVPDVVVLGGCESGTNVANTWDEGVGLSTGLLAAGVNTVVCTPLLAPDTVTGTDILVRIHTNLKNRPPPSNSSPLPPMSIGPSAGYLAITLL
jgi:tetratricopeptide (TPR) repeat protein